MVSREIEQHFRDERDKAVQDLIAKREALKQAKEDMDKHGLSRTDLDFKNRMEKAQKDVEDAEKQAKAWSNRAQGKPADRDP